MVSHEIKLTVDSIPITMAGVLPKFEIHFYMKASKSDIKRIERVIKKALGKM